MPISTQVQNNCNESLGFEKTAPLITDGKHCQNAFYKGVVRFFNLQYYDLITTFRTDSCGNEMSCMSIGVIGNGLFSLINFPDRGLFLHFGAYAWDSDQPYYDLHAVVETGLEEEDVEETSLDYFELTQCKSDRAALRGVLQTFMNYFQYQPDYFHELSGDVIDIPGHITIEYLEDQLLVFINFLETRVTPKLSTDRSAA